MRPRENSRIPSETARADTKSSWFVGSMFVTATILFLGILLIKSITASNFAERPLLLGYTIFVTAFQLSRLVNALLYRQSYAKVLKTAPPLPPGIPYEPTISFVIPCKNEEAAIQNTVEKCLTADYPREKVEVIVINDGSTDRTGEILRVLEKKYARLAVVHWDANRGKRHGMAEGFRRAKGEIVIQLDSDSYIVPSDIRAFVQPFRHPDIGAVCAHADPENADTNWLTKMQAAYYFMSFRILKAAESAYGIVFCCSGCSSAYRRDIVLPVLDTWLNEMFLGRPVTWGDDRALTNWILRKGYKTIYTDRARAFTIVPTELKQFLKQQVRWKKGWFVNSLSASTFIARNAPFVAYTYFFPLIIVTLLTPFMAFRALVYRPLTGNGDTIWFYALGVFLVASLFVVYYRMVNRNNPYWKYLFVWASINMFVLSFLLFYALATIQNRKWGTR